MSIKKVFSPANWPVLAILLLAAALRLAWLDLKPPHFDEGVNGLFIDRMADTGYYHYDPGNYHGPLHFYVLYFGQALLGRNLWAVRLPMALLSIGTVGLMLLFGQYVGRGSARWAALALSVSPAAVFYGRYAIHETWLLAALLLSALGLAGLWRNGDRHSLRCLIAGATLAVLTKETYIIHAACFLLALPALKLLEMISPSEPAPRCRQHWRWRDLSLGCGVGGLTIALFYSGFGLDPSGLTGLYRTFAVWAETGQDGHGHDKAWSYWLQLLLRYEWSALLGMAFGLALLWPLAPRFPRYVFIMAVGTVTAYSIVPYKTPWCVLVLLWPFLFVFGSAIEWLARRTGRAGLCRSGAALLVLGTLVVSLRLNFYKYDDDSEPYVYVQTYREVRRLTEPLFALAARDPATHHLPGSIRLAEYHPLPWLLGDFTAVSFHGTNSPATEPDAVFIVEEKEKARALERTLDRAFYRRDFRLRSGQKPAVAYFEARVFAPVFQGPPEFVPAAAVQPREIQP